MNKKYIVNFHVDQNFQIPVGVTAESNQIALNQAQGMINGEWISLIDVEGVSVRVRGESIKVLTCGEYWEE